MKLSEAWLREWVNPPATIEQIAQRLVMGGLELEVEPAVSEPAIGVVVGHITKAERHPQADRLQVCEVDVGEAQKLQIVCGAANARVGLKAPCAKIGARLPGGLAITQAKLRGVDSSGMLCSAKELALAEKSEGLLELDAEAKPGQAIDQYLNFADNILNLEITPNRGDCLSVLGLARDVAALFGVNLKRSASAPVVVEGHQTLKVEIESLEDCPSYAGRIVDRVSPKARTPDWMRERLRRSGIRCIHPVVDITNYVMLELGQPLHAFDADKLVGSVHVRRARAGESVTLLNEQTLVCENRELLICDDKSAVALAGVMGGAASGVSESSTRVFLESACFAPNAVAGTGRRHKVFSDAAYRFERGVDPGLQRQALDRATQLIVQICGGIVQPITQAGRNQPDVISINLRRSRVTQVLGLEIPAKEIEALLTRLGLLLRAEIGDSWAVRVPSHRYDLRIEADLIEEVGRLYGYDRIAAKPYAAQLARQPSQEAQRSSDDLRLALAARGWQEVVNLAFVEPRIQQAVAPQARTIAVDNPIADTQSQMRASLLAGLIPTWLYNRARQQERLRLFELGVCFERDEQGGVIETARIAGLAAGRVLPEQWGSAAREVDFYDVKADLEALLGSALADCRFIADAHPALHPGRCARLERAGKTLGHLGELHPQLRQSLDLPSGAIVFELELAALREVAVPKPAPLSEFPSSRRDLALVVGEEISAEALLQCARQSGGALLREARVFDVYRGKGLAENSKSVALGLHFNDASRTLTLEEIDAASSAIAQALSREFGATIRQ
ncbi:phenylalanyl-tRNA synthetase beta subunit [Solimonas aquatica]|uniref:Phenylalanine--tRNA ligase beta subunit n=1 Tax=Solimonas aquatica TaxID=489703 RepID=A0A1H9M9M9_9GAMM|nr:phenylalanine--tRNA ligase subunit beta [Solimonas aquatica]SER20388.1 phenylalanyl-tRNA synthetase beta subunit [Solimonas aquatica]